MLMTLPTLFYESLDGLENFQISAVCFGVQRSATTLIHQILRDVYGCGGVIKTHHFLSIPKGTPVVVTYRDFRDCVVSWWRTTKDDHLRRNAQEVARAIERMGLWYAASLHRPPMSRDMLNEEDAIRICGMIKKDLYHFDKYRSRHNRVLCLKYEDFAGHIERLRAPLESFLNVVIPQGVIERYTLKMNWGLKRFTDVAVPGWDAQIATKPVEDSHCHEGEIGGWRKFCSPGVADLLNDILKAELIEFGYEQKPRIETPKPKPVVQFKPPAIFDVKQFHGPPRSEDQSSGEIPTEQPSIENDASS